MKRRAFFMAALSAVLATGCGGGDDSPSPVQYVGTTLLVNGSAYPFGPIDVLYTNQLDLPAYEPERVIVQVAAGQEDSAAALLASFGLPVIARYPRFAMLVVRVPAGFEPQWVLALRDIPAVFERAWLSTFEMSATVMAP